MIFLPYNVPSKKNGRWIGGNKIINSEAYHTYVKNTEWLWIKTRQKWLDQIKDKTPPYLVGLHYVRSTNQIFDYINPNETIQDLMQKFEWIPVDDCKTIITFPFMIDGKWYQVNKHNPGVYIKLFHYLPFQALNPVEDYYNPLL